MCKCSPFFGFITLLLANLLCFLSNLPTFRTIFVPRGITPPPKKLWSRGTQRMSLLQSFVVCYFFFGSVMVSLLVTPLSKVHEMVNTILGSISSAIIASLGTM